MRVTGLRELRAAMVALEKQGVGFIRRHGELAAAELIAQEARRLVPIDTGKLHNSIRVEEFQGESGRDEVAVVAGGESIGAGYAGFVEFGTVRTPAQPFLRPAVAATIDQQLPVMVQAMRRPFREMIRAFANRLFSFIRR